MDIRPIRTEGDYDWALAEIAPYFDDIPEKARLTRIDLMSWLIWFQRMKLKTIQLKPSVLSI